MIDQLFQGFEDLSGTFTVMDVTLAMVLSFVLCGAVGVVYRTTHKGISYTQSYVQTLVMMGMVVALIMMIVGSNIARAFSLVGALSIIRFRNAVKETRDVGFIFFAMAIGMACGTRFYLLAVIATVVIGGAMYLMNRFDWFSRSVESHIVKVQVPAGGDYSAALDSVFVEHTTDAELVSIESIRGGALNELLYSVRLKSGVGPGDLVTALQGVTDGQKATVLTGYDRSEL